ncbi:TetR/AcrR family transcriptional regulator [Clostridium sp. OS1-26]|uniref:TetR/AcrR family transcriptional regulator n=1 Tax=Clostridium sp. OS1-26 TaxID=3070681 RepID=UPI0027DF087F|nr:TetR/AcrR family transcriptional regulator [Clostridium sp. OS1-26]WML37380.1 TetR/AcrR family transcriptional regulator [Clostridium sp. OS1-26]
MEEKLTNRQIQAMNTKNNIYNAAAELLENNGYQNIRIEDICKKAGVSVGSFYTHFNSKNDILVEIFKRADDYFREEVSKSLGNKSVFDKIIDYFDYYAKYDESLGIDMAKQLYTFDNKMFITEGRHMQGLLNEIIIDAQKNGYLCLDIPAAEITKQLFVVARGVVYDWCLHDGGYNVREAMRNFIKRMLITYQIR